MNQGIDIPDKDSVFMRVHKVNLDLSIDDPIKQIRPVAFDPRGGNGLSVDWSAHCTPLETKNRASNPADNGVVSMPVKGIREIPSLDIIHTPDYERDNYAHSEIIGVPPRKPSDMGIRVRLMDICSWIIPPSLDNIATN